MALQQSGRSKLLTGHVSLRLHFSHLAILSVAINLVPFAGHFILTLLTRLLKLN